MNTPKPPLVARLAIILLTASSGVLVAQTPAGPAGHWEGTIQVPGQEMKIVIDLAGAGENWEGTISVPVQNLKGYPLSAITVKGDSVSFAMKGVPGDPQFNGTLAKDAKGLSGDFTQGGASMTFALTRTGEPSIERPPKSTPITKDLEGSWDSTLDVDGKSLRLTLKLSNQPSGVASGTLVSVDQGGAEIPIASVVQTGTRLTLLLPVIAGTYEGDLKDAQLTGTWTQGPRSWPLVFKRSK
jgi:hypothetical protein